LLAEHFLRQFTEKSARGLTGFSSEAMNALLSYEWPGNVRELANVVERAAVMSAGPLLSHVDLPGRAAAGSTGPCFDLDLGFKDGRQKVITDFERAYLVNCLNQHKGNIAQSAQQCGIDTKTFYRKMQDYGLDKRDFKKTAQD
jgi:DNA-binding NtrC family response regulator